MRMCAKTLHPTFLDVSLLDTSPIITMKNTTVENTEGGCESIIRGQDHASNVLAQMEFHHEGTADDYKGGLLLYTNTGSALTAALSINESQFVGIGNHVDAGTLLQLAYDGNAYLTLQNLTAENSEGGAETRIIFEDHAAAALAQIEGSHSGTADDTKGKLILSTHTGSALTAALTISDTQLATFASNVLIPDAGYIGAASATTAIQIEADGDILLVNKLGVGITPAATIHAFIAATTGSSPLEMLRLEVNDGGVELDAGMGPAINFYMPHNTASFLGAAIAARKESNVDDAESTNLIFSTCPDTGSNTVRMRISDTGLIGVGNDVDAGTLMQLALDGDAYLTLQNLTNENSEGGAETRIIFEDHVNNALAQIEGSHSGTSDDYKGKFIISTNTGSALTAALTISDTQLATFASNILIPDAGYIGSASATTAVRIEADGDVLLANNLGVGITPAAPIHAFIAATTGSSPLELLRLEVNDGGVDLAAGMGPAINFYMPHDAASFLGAAIAARKESAVDDAESTNLIFSTCPDAGSNTVRMRIGDTGLIGIGADVDAGTLLQMALDGDAYLTLQNLTAENSEGGAETRIIFEDHAAAALAQIEGSHSGTADDTKGKFIISTHTGSALTAAITVDDTQAVTFAGTVTVPLLGVTGDGVILTLKNDQNEHTQDAAESSIQFTDHGDNVLAQIRGAHDGTADDDKGVLILYANNDTAATEVLRLDSALLATFAAGVTATGAILASNYEATNKLTTAATNAGELDFTAASKKLDVEDNAVVSQDYSSDASPTFANVSIGTGELTAGSINRATGTLLLEIGGTAEISITSTTSTFGGNILIPDAGQIGSASDTNAITISATGEVDITAHDLATTGLKLGGTLVTSSAAELNLLDGMTQPQEQGDVLDDLNTVGAVTGDSYFLVGTGAGAFAWETTTTVRTSMGVGTGNSPQFTGIELGHASDTTITRASAGDLNIEGNVVYRAGGTDVPVTDGGTGVGTLTDHGILLGSGTAAVTPMTALGAGEIVYGVAGSDPAALAAGATTTILVGGGAAAPVWTTATGTGAPARAGNPTFAGATVDGGDLTMTGTATNHILLPLNNDASTPTLAFGDGDDGFYSSQDNQLEIALWGAARYTFQTGVMGSANGTEWGCMKESATATNPVFVPDRSDADTGIGYSGADALSIVAGGVEGIRITEATTITSRLSDKTSFSNTAEGNTGSLNIQTAHETHTLAAAATSDTTINIPSGVMLLSVSFCVNTAVTDTGGDDTWNAQFHDGAGMHTLATNAAAAQNTKVNTLIDASAASIITDAVTNVRFTPNGGNFSAGVIEIIAYYVDLTSLANA